MLRIIAGFEKPTKGRVLIDEKVVSSQTVFVPPEKRDIGMVFQSYAVWPHMTVRENVAYPLEIKKVDKGTARKKLTRYLPPSISPNMPIGFPVSFPEASSNGSPWPGHLSQSRNSCFWTNRFPTWTRNSGKHAVRNQGDSEPLAVSVVYVTHDQTEAMAMSDRIVVINNGTVQQVGAPSAIYNDPANPFVADFVGKIDFLSGLAEEGRIKLDDSLQSIPYDGSLRCPVIVGIRPEWISYAETGNLKGTVKSHYYLGDVNDCRIDIGEARNFA